MRILREEAGQVLVQLAVLLVVLLAAVALAVDVGRFYQERRHMQNAADAGALAGARALCMDLGAGAASAWATDFRARNGGGGPAPTIDVGAGTVAVRSTIVSQSFMAQVIGVFSATIAADASARCGCTNAVCQLFPVTYKEDLFLTAANYECGHQFLLWADSTTRDPADYDLEGLNPVPSIARAWVDFSAAREDGVADPCDQTGCGNSELRDRIRGKTTGDVLCQSYAKIPSCIPGDSGVKNDSWKEVEELPAGTIVRIPLWDTMGCSIPNDPGNACASLRYHICSASCVRIMGTRLLKPKVGGGPKVRVILVQLVCSTDGDAGECFTSCGGSSGPNTPGCLRAVSLTH